MLENGPEIKPRDIDERLREMGKFEDVSSHIDTFRIFERYFNKVNTGIYKKKDNI